METGCTFKLLILKSLLLLTKQLIENNDVQFLNTLQLNFEPKKKITDVDMILNNNSVIDQLDETNFLLFAARCYDNPQCYDTYEFQEDLNRFKYIKRLFRRYLEEDDLKERLIINHIVILNNVFGQNAPRMMFMKMRGYESLLKTFLMYLNMMPESIEKIGIECRSLKNIDIEIDPIVLDRLKKL